jgi:Flp pilus assembly protein TadD
MHTIAKDLKEGHAQHLAGRLDLAEACYRRVLAREPDNCDALNLLGIACVNTERAAEGVAMLERCTKLYPKIGGIWNNLGTGYRALGRLEEAVEAHRKAIALEPGDADTWNNLGIVLKALLRIDEALEAYGEALRLKPDFPKALNNLGAIYATVLRFDEAIAFYRKALALKPDYISAHFNESAAQLVQGNYKIGWLKYEFRWASVQKKSQRGFKQPFWRGDFDLTGKTLLLHAEQGLGDTLQFSRYLPLVAKKAAAVYLEVQAPLKALCEASYPEARAVLAQGEPLPAFDAHCPLLSLPFAFKTELSSIPATIPYLRGPQEKLAFWAQRLGVKNRPRVAFVWAGNCKNTDDRNRSLALEQVAPLMSAGDFDSYILQKDRSTEDGAKLAKMQGVTDLGPQLDSFLDTAAALRQMDLLVTVDTSVAHLAGALGVPAWVMVQYSPDWRWLLKRDDSPWYPSGMRLFRQPALGDWAGVIGAVGSELGRLKQRE